jgi:hypothetical protein
MPRIASNIKQLIVPKGKAPRKIQFGIFKDLIISMDLASRTQLYLGLYERELYPWLEKLSSGIHTAIDIGANEGEYTLYFLAKTASKKILSFEPSLESQAQLRANLALNALDNDSRLELSAKFVTALDGENECTLDSYLATISSPCLIKMDVDGGEVDILRGANQLLKLPSVRWIIETHSQQLEEQCIEILNQAGFLTKIIPNSWYRLFIPELRPTHNRWLVALTKNDAQFYKGFPS